jgi:hypothetical protein
VHGFRAAKSLALHHVTGTSREKSKCIKVATSYSASWWLNRCNASVIPAESRSRLGDFKMEARPSAGNELGRPPPKWKMYEDAWICKESPNFDSKVAVESIPPKKLEFSVFCNLQYYIGCGK